MKKVHIFVIIIIAVAIGVIMSTAGDASSYVSFKEATELSEDGKDKKVHVVGKLKKDPAGQIIGMTYQPHLDANHFEFVLVDQNNEERQVVYNQPKPQDFERSEQIVVIGSIQGETFKADKILMKCPSKYQENEIKVNGSDSKGVEAKL
ncbi:cytochrome c maturation protein CcmE [Rhodocytophaga aerolata]|uniref:Cytochrome c maturation protein CcmE n=1 Tax=Rhodocytophaga aerolata TaxID=455078 RepID=A0ABT8R0H4_9BACT|nr:cytochrome c maturation protein CcmE [Rhodocytophaga aerolata]MDO1445590.1 cytochrome c maturation protein CcmE [Rhodocytophaga aerolata]